MSTEGERGGQLRDADGATREVVGRRAAGEPVRLLRLRRLVRGGLSRSGLARPDWSADAIALAARCGAACLTGRGPYERQLRRLTS